MVTLIIPVWLVILICVGALINTVISWININFLKKQLDMQRAYLERKK